MQLVAQASATRNAELEARSQPSNTHAAEFEAQARAYRIRNAELEAERKAIPKSAAEYMRPTMKTPISPVVLHLIAAHFFELRPHFLALIRTNQFHADPLDTKECPLKHIKLFTDLCNTIAFEEVSSGYIQMKAFKFSLGGRASTWFDNLAPRSITTWTQLAEAFTNKFFPASKTAEFRRKIHGFEQGATESLNRA